ncbi:hypothetical protein V1477_008772 [Vespula maculifrons]|uniref:Uncharacterized protein n=1 Tax=Vespula maculifrons TaxID=7453 RepID=A0ABD2CGB4_VESMC
MRNGSFQHFALTYSDVTLFVNAILYRGCNTAAHIFLSVASLAAKAPCTSVKRVDVFFVKTTLFSSYSYFYYEIEKKRKRYPSKRTRGRRKRRRKVVSAYPFALANVGTHERLLYFSRYRESRGSKEARRVEESPGSVEPAKEHQNVIAIERSPSPPMERHYFSLEIGRVSAFSRGPRGPGHVPWTLPRKPQ